MGRAERRREGTNSETARWDGRKNGTFKYD